MYQHSVNIQTYQLCSLHYIRYRSNTLLTVEYDTPKHDLGQEISSAYFLFRSTVKPLIRWGVCDQASTSPHLVRMGTLTLMPWVEVIKHCSVLRAQISCSIHEIQHFEWLILEYENKKLNRNRYLDIVSCSLHVNNPC